MFHIPTQNKQDLKILSEFRRDGVQHLKGISVLESEFKMDEVVLWMLS